jgi:hypothetical protein
VTKLLEKLPQSAITTLLGGNVSWLTKPSRTICRIFIKLRHQPFPCFNVQVCSWEFVCENVDYRAAHVSRLKKHFVVREIPFHFPKVQYRWPEQVIYRTLPYLQFHQALREVRGRGLSHRRWPRNEGRRDAAARPACGCEPPSPRCRLIARRV